MDRNTRTTSSALLQKLADRVGEVDLHARQMTSKSRAFRVLWWLVCLIPPLNLALAAESRSAGSADEALGGVFLTGMFLLALVGFAPFVVVPVLKSSAATRRERIGAVVLGVSIVPMFVLVSALWGLIGWQNRRDSTVVDVGVSIALTAGWIIGCVALRRWYARAQ